MTSAATPDAGIETSRALCPYASTIECYTLDDREPRMIGQGCRKWTCPICGPRRHWQFVQRIRTASPNRFITLTCDRTRDPATQLKRMRTALPRLATALRTSVGTFEYLRMLEQCKDGYPHFHLLARSAFVPQSHLRTLWQKLTGATIVDIRKAHGRSTSYIAKYLGKARDKHGDWSRQRVSVSKHFWPEVLGEQTHIAFTHSRMHPTQTAENRPTTTFERLRPAYYCPHAREPGDANPEELTAAPEFRYR